MNSTQNTGEDWDKLLDALTDEELDQYGQMATDQVRKEVRWLWAHVALVVAALAAAGWSLMRGFEEGFDRKGLLTLGLSALMLYWPWRSARTRRLWRGHRDVVRKELDRRHNGSENEG